VVDTETTGVYRSDRIVEVAMYTLDLDGQVADVYETLVNPCRDVSASHIHGITASLVTDAPTFADIAGEIALRLHGACLVAHNVPFDRRMLTNEFDRLGEALVVNEAVDTLAASGQRLTGACATFGINLNGAHEAGADAWATAQLFLQLAGVTHPGGPMAAPVHLDRRPRVRRRCDTVPVVLAEPSLISFLASRLALQGLAVNAQQYLEFVGRAVADLHFDIAERAELAGLAIELGLTDAQRTQAHRRYLNELIDAAVADAIVTDEEHDALIRVASALGIDEHDVEVRINAHRMSSTSLRRVWRMRI
jgi:DNA polymerase-3 subunit epsilon